MHKVVLSAAVAVFVVFASIATAITNGVPDGTAHPEVGALLAPHAFSDGTWAECTGTLISPRVFLNRCPLRRRAEPGQGHVRLELRRSRNDVHRRLA
jgi:hypothetical protein